MGVPSYTIDDFLRDMGRPLQYSEPTTVHNYWVFWSQEEGEGEGGGDLGPVNETLTNNNNWGNFQDYLKSTLCKAGNANWGNVVLIQFWIPTSSTSSKNGGRCVLETSNQPFAIYKFERRLCEHRKYCTGLEINIFQHEKDNEDEFGRVIGRLFRHKQEQNYFFADNWNSLFLPLFKPSGWCCYGVLEISVTSNSAVMYLKSYFLYDSYGVAKATFKEANLINPPLLELLESTEIEEINKALQVVCTARQIPLAQIWIPCCTDTAMACVDSPGERCQSPYLRCSNKFSSSISQEGDADFHSKIEGFNRSCKSGHSRAGQGIVDQALLYSKSCFCRDVHQLPKAVYALSLDAHSIGLTGCCAIWLHSTRTKNHDYVLEFYFPPQNNFSEEPEIHLKFLLATVKKQLPGFKISSVGEESCVEVCEISVNDDAPDSVIISQTFSVKPVPEFFVNEKETVQNEVVSETVIDNGSNILGLEGNGTVVCHSEKTDGEELFVEVAPDDEITIRLPPMPESLRNENEVVLSDDEPTMEEAVRKNVGIVKQTNEAVTSSEIILSRAEASEREYITTDITLSREDLTKHFGKTLGDAAEILDVSRSTMKRACRFHKINRWPPSKRKKVNALHVHSGNEGIEGTYKGDPSCSDPPPTPATAGISHKTSNSRQEQDVGTVTIKATHGGDTIRFDLPILSRKTDLVKQVTKRLPLNEGSFNIKYQDEDNDWILIACDEDLEQCIGIWKGKSTIKMFVQPNTNQAP